MDTSRIEEVKTLIGTGRRAAHHEREGLGGRDVDAIREWCDDQPRSITKIFVVVGHDGITNSYFCSLASQASLRISGRVA